MPQGLDLEAVSRQRGGEADEALAEGGQAFGRTALDMVLSRLLRKYGGELRVDRSPFNAWSSLRDRAWGWRAGCDGGHRTGAAETSTLAV